MDIIIDFQGLWDNSNNFVPKEFCLSIVNKQIMEYKLISPPFSKYLLNPQARRQNQWNVKKTHGISWRQGNTTLSQDNQIIKEYAKKSRRIYTKGNLKHQYLK